MRFFAAALIFFGVAASYAQAPEVPHKIHFAGMSLTIRDDAKREIQKDVDALTQHARYFGMKVERARMYFPIIEKIFQEEHLPEDFKFLVLQESALVPDAVSVSNAVGFWQFKDFTAREVGLRVDNEVDERMNIVSASRGAARYFKQNNNYFNNWLLALQAYQMGAGGVKQTVGDKYNGDTHMEITSETYWYVKKFLAHKIAFENAVQGAPALKVTLYETSEKKLSDIASDFSVDESVLKEYNKWAKSGVVPDDKRYAVVVPSGNVLQDFNSLAITSEKASKATRKHSTLVASRKQINGVETLQAISGENLSAFAARAGITVSSVMVYNDIAIDHVIKRGAYYFIKKKKKKSTLPNSYKSRLGDDLWSVSQQYGIRLKQLRQMNPAIEDQMLDAGTVIKLNKSKAEAPALQMESSDEVVELGRDTFWWAAQPSPEKSKEIPAIVERPIQKEDSLRSTLTLAPLSQQNTQQVAGNAMDNSNPTIYEVKSSDTLYGVARQFGVTIKDLMDWNNKTSLSITTGEKLKILRR